MSATSQGRGAVEGGFWGAWQCRDDSYICMAVLVPHCFVMIRDGESSDACVVGASVFIPRTPSGGSL